MAPAAKAIKKPATKSPDKKANETTKASKLALKLWATRNGWHYIFLDAKSGAPTTGIVDVMLVRAGRKDRDRLEIRLVQLKGGSGGLKAQEWQRLRAACQKVVVRPAVALYYDSTTDVVFPSDNTTRW